MQHIFIELDNVIMRFKKILFLFLFLMVNFAQANQSLRILNPNEFQGYEGSIKEVEIRCRPLGVYMQVDLYLTFSAGEFPVWNYGEEEQLEIVYEFELPEEAISIESWLWIDGQIIPAKIKDLRTAVTEYEYQVQRKKDPSLLTKKSSREYELRVYPLLAKEGATREVKISYLTPVTWTSKNVSTTLPASFFPSYNPIETMDVLMYTNEEWISPLVNFNNQLIYETGEFVNKGPFTKTVLSETDLENGITISYPNPAENGVYLNRFRDVAGWGYYEMALIPSLFMDKDLNRDLFFVCDFVPGNTSVQSFLEELKEAIKINLNGKDRFNLSISAGVAKAEWTNASEGEIDAFFSSLDTIAFYEQELQQSILHGDFFIDVIGASLNSEMVIISNRTNYDTEGLSDALYGNVSNELSSTKVSVIDLSEGGGKFWVGGIQYQGNAFFYKKIAEAKNGVRLKTSNVAGGLLSILSIATNKLDEVFVETDVARGYTYGGFVVNEEVKQSYDRAYMEVGKFSKDTTFEIEVIVENKDASTDYFSFEVFDDVSIVPSDSMIRKMWSGQQIFDELSKLPSSDEDEIIGRIVELSLSEQILTPYTAFLALPPEDMDTIVCLHCGDESVTGVEDEFEEVLFFSLHPSPAIDRIHFVFAEEDFKISLVEIIDMKGRVVYKGELPDNNSLDVSFLAVGVYQCVVYGNNEQHSIRLVKK